MTMNSLSYHQQELEERINKFSNECDIAISHIKNLKYQAKNYLNELACDPKLLKERFLRCTRQLDEFMYHITEFNLTAGKLENVNRNRNTNKTVPSNFAQKSSPSHSNKQKSAEKKYYKKEPENWRESCATPCIVEKSKNIANNDSAKDDTLAGSQPLAFPPQPKLDPASDSEANIITIDGTQLWLVVDSNTFINLVSEMTEYYKEREQSQYYIPENVCAYYDEETRSYFRAVHIKSELELSEVFLVDTGEFQQVNCKNLRPLHPKFCVTPPLAHLCSLADVDQTDDKTLEDRQAEFLSQYLGSCLKMELKIDDSETDDISPPSVYLFLDDGRCINELLVQALASGGDINNEINHLDGVNSIIQDENENIGDETDIIEHENAIGVEIDDVQGENRNITDEGHVQGHFQGQAVDNANLDEELDYSKYPEYENAVEAVTGYSNRDEMDICKHYNGGDGCFKGSLCKKRHVMMHPDGWTMDRVPVTTKCRPAELPPPGSWHKVKVTHVDERCRLYVQFEEKDDVMSLADMVEEMTQEAAKSGPLQLDPAPGELVSAPFEDGRHYRARVLAADGSKAEVFYIDFGNTSEVSLSELRALATRWRVPPRALACRLAGAGAGAEAGAEAEAGAVAGAVSVLRELALDKTMEAQIITRDFDEMSVKLVDSEGFDLAEQFAAFAGIPLQSYTIEDDSRRRVHHVPA